MAAAVATAEAEANHGSTLLAVRASAVRASAVRVSSRSSRAVELRNRFMQDEVLDDSDRHSSTCCS